MSLRPRDRHRPPALADVSQHPEQSMKRNAAVRRLRRRAARGHPLWWVLAGIVVGVAGTMAALWRNADDEPERQLGVTVPDYLGDLVAARPASAPVAAPSRPRAD